MKRKKNGHYTYKSTIFLYLMILTFIPIVVLGAYSYHTYMKEVSKKVVISAEGTVRRTRVNVDTALVDIRRYYTGQTLGEEIKWMLSRFMDYSQYSQLKKATEMMAGGHIVSDYIQGYSFINFKTNWVLGNYGMFRYSQLQNKEEIGALLETEITGKNYVDNTSWKYFAKKEETNTWTERNKILLEGLCLVYKLPVTNKDTYAMMIIQVKMDQLYSLMKQGLNDEDITVCDEEGSIIFTTNPEVAAELEKQRKEGKSFETLNRIKANDKEYLIIASESNVVGWTYIVSNDWSAIRKEATSILSFMVCLLFLIVAATVVALRMTNKLYEPVSKLTEQISEIDTEENHIDSAHKAEGHKNELDYISEKIDKLVDSRTMLENLMLGQQSQLMDLFQMRLLRGDIKETEIIDYMKRFGIHQKEFCEAVCMILKPADGDGGLFQNTDDAGQDALRIDWVENLTEELKSLFLFPPICHTSTLFGIITSDSEEHIVEQSTSIYERLEKYTSEKYQCHLSMGVSSAHKKIHTIRSAYHESIEALKSRELSKAADGGKWGLTFYLEIMQNTGSYQYNRPAEREIKMCIDKGDKEASYQAIDAFVDELIEKEIPQGELPLYLQRLLMAILLVITDAGIPAEEVFQKNISILFANFNQIYDLNKIKSYLKYKIAEPIIDKLVEYRADKSAGIVAQIQKLIQESSGDISLAECAEKLGYHPTYLWKIMKMENNSNFSDYMGNYKLEEAKRYLLETDMTISEIATQLKYTNSQNFIRFFNKMEGITPGKYRQMNQKRKISK